MLNAILAYIKRKRELNAWLKSLENPELLNG